MWLKLYVEKNPFFFWLIYGNELSAFPLRFQGLIPHVEAIPFYHLSHLSKKSLLRK